MGRTYIGCTIKMATRLRQHNGEITGGARQTAKGRPWSVVCTVSGFRTKYEGLKFEYAWRRVHKNSRPRPPYTVDGRCVSLQKLMEMEKWSSKSPLASEVQLSVEYR